MPTVRDLLDLVERDYRAHGKRSLPAIPSRRRHLERFFGDRIPGAGEIDEYKLSRLESGAAPATVRNELSILRRGFVLGRRHGLVAEVPEIEFPLVRNRRAVIATPEEVSRLIAALEVLDEDVGHLVLWLVLTGWRTGESRRLLWRSVASDLSVVRLHESETKACEERTVHIGEAGQALLSDRADRRHRDTDLVFHRRGRPIRTFRQSWIRAARAAGRPELRPHDLRRTYAALARCAGVSVAVQMATAGWSDAASHYRYSVVPPREQADSMDAIFRVGFEK